jgi:porin
MYKSFSKVMLNYCKVSYKNTHVFYVLDQSIKQKLQIERKLLSILMIITLPLTYSSQAQSFENVTQNLNSNTLYSSQEQAIETYAHVETSGNNSSNQNSIDSNNSSPYDDAVSGNPVFMKFDPGTGLLGRKLQIPDDWGVRLGGISLADTNKIFSGGKKPGAFSSNNLLILGIVVDTEKKIGWKGGDIGVNFLQFNGQNTNGYAGTLPGYDSTSPLAPFNRTELYEYWFAQDIITDKLKVRIGKTLPAVDFNNVTRPETFKDSSQNVSSLSSLLFVSIFVNPTILLGVYGCFADSIFGTTVNLAPTKSTWVNAGIYDGNTARGVQTGIHNPHINNYLFGISEAGTSWLVGSQNHPGQLAIGVWYQTGTLKTAGIYNDLKQTGTGGIYLYGGQRIWAEHSEISLDENEDLNPKDVLKNSKKGSICIIYQYGVNDSKTLPVRQFVGFAITAFSMSKIRPHDSFGAGMSLSFMNQNEFKRAQQLMFQTYYQAALIPNLLFIQPTLSYIPQPALMSTNSYDSNTPANLHNLPPTIVGTLSLTSFF